MLYILADQYHQCGGTCCLQLQVLIYHLPNKLHNMYCILQESKLHSNHCETLKCQN